MLKGMSASAELFEKIAHPTRIRILKTLESSPMSFGELKSELEISSSGNLDFHLKKLEGLIAIGPVGKYTFTDEGREALVAVRIIESSVTARANANLGKVELSGSFSNSFILIWTASLFMSFSIVPYFILGESAAYSIGQGAFVSLFSGGFFVLFRWAVRRRASRGDRRDTR